MALGSSCFAEPFVKGSYAPVGIAYSEEQGEPLSRLLLLGGSQGPQWFRHTDLPLTVQGVRITTQNALEFDNGEDIPCETALASPQQTMALYTAAGRVGEAVIKQTLFFTHASSGEIFIAADFVAPKQPGRGLVVGVNGNWDAMPAKTNRAEENGNITFSTGTPNDASFASVVLTTSKNADGDVFFKGEVVLKGKIHDVGNFYSGDPSEISGFFIDLNGDGRMEFVINVQGAAGSVSIINLDPESVAEVMNLDFGD